MEKEKKKPTKIEHLPTWDRKVLSVIRPGKSNAIKVKGIISLIGGTDVSIRQAVHELIVKHRYKIVGCADGFYIPTNKKELGEGVRNLAGRITTMSQRLDILMEVDDSDG